MTRSPFFTMAKLNPYLNFEGKTKEAMEFYKQAFGGALRMTSYREFGMTQDPAEADKIMHASLVGDGDITIMAADLPKGMPLTVGTNVAMSLSGEDDAELRGYWDKLAAGGMIAQPLTQAPWGDTFGMFTDKFGIRWMVNIIGKKA